MHINQVDLLLLAVFGLAILDGRRRGLAPYVSELSAFSLALGLAFVLFQPLGSLLHRALGVSAGIAGFGSFLLLLVAGHALAQVPVRPLAGRLAEGLRPRLGPARFRQAGAVPAVGTAVVISAVVLSGLVVLPGNDTRSLVLGSALGSTLAQGSAFMQPGLRSLLVPASHDTRSILQPGASPDTGENAFYKLQFPPNLQVELDVPAENHMLEQINRVRSQAGLSQLAMDPLLQEVARLHSRDMYQRRYFSHDTPDHKTPYDRMREQRVHYVTAGENIAFAPDGDQAWESLMHSPDHRANILNPDFRCVGIGAYRGSGYEEMFTQDFADCSS